MSEHKVYNTPLLKKIGCNQHQKIVLQNVPAAILKELRLEKISFDVKPVRNVSYDLVWIFLNTIKELESLLPVYKQKIVSNGMIWVSWYKKSSNRPTELTEDIIRNTALALDLVDIKVASVDHQWSALKLVIPLAKRN